MLVVDPFGEIFTRVRELGLPGSLWRVLDVKRLQQVDGVDLSVYAVYDRVDWSVADLLAQRTQAVVVSTTFNRDDALASLEHGLAGYIDAAISPEAFRRSLTGAMKGEPAFNREVTGMWLRVARSARLHSPQDSKLTPRQRQILEFIARGATDKEIAVQLGIATATAQKHVTNILERLHVPNRAAAVAVIARRL